MRLKFSTYLVLVIVLLGYRGGAQELAAMNFEDELYEEAYDLAYDGKHQSAKKVLTEGLKDVKDNIEAHFLLASTYSWDGQYDKARSEFNKLTSKAKTNRDIWISAIKNELYAKTYATALGLANKAAYHIKEDGEIIRLKELALIGVQQTKYGDKGWFNQESIIKGSKALKKANKRIVDQKEETIPKEKIENEEDAAPKNRVGVNNAFTVFNERYDPVIFSSVSYRRQTKMGVVIPRLNYSNRNGVHGLQYNIDFYPKFLKRFYAYLNYGYSNAFIYPSQKFGGDIYLNLPNAMEISAGGRYIQTANRDVKAITNSLGYYMGNYYFSLRSFVSPRENNLLSVSGNLLVRKYLKDAENYLGVTIGMGFSPELQQLIVGDDILSETVLYVESQRMGLQYQFTTKKSPNIYRANLGVRRQELAFDSGNFFWAISAGMTYEVKF